MNVLLYPIVDVDACESKRVQPAKLATWLSRAGVTLLQLRAKRWNAERTLELVLEVQRGVGTECRIVVNDRVDVAVRAGCHGVHVGQTDLPVAAVRDAAPEVAVGVSTHSLEQVNSALQSRPDYIAIGPVFATQSKRDPEPTVGVDGLQAAWGVCQRAGVPLVAIGGVTPQNVELVRPYCDYVAVIAAITHPDEDRVVEAVRAFLKT